jgi:FKBP-type peptidyl-prolyl cis-trans isomerase (trigger factor)
MTKERKNYEKAEIKKLDKSQVEIVGSILPETWASLRPQALKNINESITLDGFRKGMIPENVLVAKVGQMAILEEIAELVMPKAYLDILIDHKIDAIGKPQIHVTKLAEGNPIEFKITTSVVPEVKLPDYKSLAAEEIKKVSPDEEKVTDKDVEEAILRIRKSRASHEGHDHSKMTPEEHDKAIMENLPELNDEFVKTLGQFKDVSEFKEKVKEMVAEEKKNSAQEKLRLRIADSIVAATEVELPDVMIESELHRIESQFESDIERMGVKLDDYLKHAKKTREDLRKEWAPHAEKKAKLQLLLNEIAKAENIKPDQNEIEAEVNHIVEHYKDADRERAAVYAETVLTNEKVFQFLEGQK